METIKTEIKPCRFKLFCMVVMAQFMIVAVAAIMIGVHIYRTGNHLRITPNSVSFGYFEELDESKEAQKFAAQVEREIAKNTYKAR